MIKKKLHLWLNCMANNKTEVFPTLHDFLCTNELCRTDSMKHEITAHLSELAAQLRRYFPQIWQLRQLDMSSSYSCACVLIQITTDRSLKVEFNQKISGSDCAQNTLSWPNVLSRL